MMMLIMMMISKAINREINLHWTTYRHRWKIIATLILAVTLSGCVTRQVVENVEQLPDVNPSPVAKPIEKTKDRALQFMRELVKRGDTIKLRETTLEPSLPLHSGNSLEELG